MEEETRTEQSGLITEELRDWMGASTHNTIGTELIMGSYNKLLAIADRIDAEHQKAEDEWKAKDGQSWLHGYAECRAELMEGNEAIAASLEEAGWVRLPVDADGVPIRVGDVVEERSGHTFEVASLMAFGGSDNWLVLSDARNFSSFREPHDLRHHHEPTVEDVLREFAYGLGVPVADSYVAATAAKLRLAEEDE